MNKLKYVIGIVTGMLASCLLALKTYAVASTTVIVSGFGTVLDGVVEEIVTAVTSFLTSNLPVIVVLGVVIGMVFWLIGKARRATRGG